LTSAEIKYNRVPIVKCNSDLISSDNNTDFYCPNFNENDTMLVYGDQQSNLTS